MWSVRCCSPAPERPPVHNDQVIAAHVVDALVILLVLGYVSEGVRAGVVRSVAAVTGLIAGVLAVSLAIPWVEKTAPNPSSRLFLVLAAVVVLIALGSLAGAAIGRAQSTRRRRRTLHPLDRVGGGVINLLVGGLTAALIAGSIASLGIPIAGSAVSNSFAVQGIDKVIPQPVSAALARLRTAAVAQGLPVISGLKGLSRVPAPPKVATNTAPLHAAAASVVRIVGTAYACGRNQSGSGFVVSPDRILTNAHVVAGVQQPIIEAPDGQTLDGRVVYFDPDNDLAVIAVRGLTSAPLGLSAPLTIGSTGVVDGYPYGGPFTSGGATVAFRANQSVENIYGTHRTLRDLYTLAATVEPGNSGGPLLTPNGTVAGIVFAKSTDTAHVGYAITDTLLTPVVQRAATLSTPVPSGNCAKG